MPMIDLNNTLNFSSSHYMHKWGGTHIGGLAAPRSIEPRVPITPRTLRSVSLSHPLSSLSDEVVKAPNVWAVRRPSNDKIVSMLTGCAENTPRLTPFDRTRHQPRQDVTKATSYVMDYCRPASVRSSMHSLPPLEGRSGTIGFGDSPSSAQRDIFRSSKFGEPASARALVAHLDAPYSPFRHGLRASVRPKDWNGPDPGY